MGAAMAALAAVQMAGSAYQAQGLKSQGRMEEAQNNFNAKMAEVTAKDALDRGEKDAASIRRQAKGVMGSQRAGYAGQGVLVDSGTAGDMVDDTRRMSEEDMTTAKNNAWRESFGHRVQASNYRMAGKMARWGSQNQAKNALISGGLWAGMSLMQRKR